MQFDIRPATIDDAEVIARHRARMFQEMGMVPEKAFASFCSKSTECIAEALRGGEYIGWLASPIGKSKKIIAGAGVQVRQVMPHPLGDSRGVVAIVSGRQGIILNVFTEPPWRRRGLARLLMRRIIAWAGQERLDELVLHASDEGRLLYEQLGFIASSEMRYASGLNRGGQSEQR